MSVIDMPVCDFCGKNRTEVNRMVAGAGNEKHICDACILESAWIVGEDAAIEGVRNVGRKVIPFAKPFPQGRA